MYIDTHCHLNFGVFKEDYRQVVERALKAGVKKIIVPGTDLKSSKRAIEIAEEFEGVFCTVGFHPHHVKGLNKIDAKIIEELKEIAKNKKVVGIGECGLDYYVYQKTKYKNTEIDKKQKVLQKKLFGRQIQLAKELDLPLVIHNRQAEKDMLDVIDHFCKNDGQYPKGVWHCIEGSLEYVKRGLEMGFYIGVDGNVTYDEKVEALVKQVPMDRILLETDSPYLTPEPIRSEKKNRGEKLRNEPISVKIVGQYIAELKNISLEKVEASSTNNAEALFNV